MTVAVAGLGPIRQNGFVVDDLDAALHHWTAVLGVGPFYVIERVDLDWFQCGDSTTVPELSIALANSGDLQIELICQRDETRTSYLEFLARGGEGLQHVAFWTVDYDVRYEALCSQGLPLAQAGQIGGPQGRFAYFDPGGPRGPMLELSDVSGPKGRFFDHIRRVAADWDGSRPIRIAS